MKIGNKNSFKSQAKLVLGDRVSGVQKAIGFLIGCCISGNFSKKLPSLYPTLLFAQKVGVKMNEMSEKPIYRILNLVSLLALTYYAATSINYIFQSDAHIYSYDSQSNSNGSTAQLEAHRSGK